MSHLLAGQLLGKKFGSQDQLSYMDKIIATAPIAYWPLNETSGVVATNYGTLGVAANGIYTGVTLAQTSAPGGGLAGLWDGSGAVCNIYSSPLAAVLNLTAGTTSIWGKVLNASVWLDGVIRRLFYFRFSSTDHRSVIYKVTTNNRISGLLNSGGATVPNGGIRNFDGAYTDWTRYTLAWGGGTSSLFVNGIQISTEWSIGAWNSSPVEISYCNIGSDDASASQFTWNGYLAHMTIWDYKRSPSQILDDYQEGI